MPDEQQSEYNQSSFKGGMNLSIDDSRLGSDQYRIGFNLSNRLDQLDPFLSSIQDDSVPVGIIQEMLTFGVYEIVFVSGYAYYKLYTNSAWTRIDNFHMDEFAPRYWTKAIPVSTTNYLRLATAGTVTGLPSSSLPISIDNVAGAAQGNLPGLLVQDNINQSQFIFLSSGGIPTCRTTQKFTEWSITFTDATNTAIAVNGDKREYVPIGNEMEYTDGVLYIASQDGNFILRSVSGRPLDFVINVTNALVTVPPFTQIPGGDAFTTSYSVGVGPISCLKALSSNSLFVAAGNANFMVQKDTSNNAIREFGEYKFIRTFLFNSNCLSSRAIIDSIGDTRFIDLTGVRSFNAVAQLQNEGRNSPFTLQIQGAFVKSKGVTAVVTLVQDPSFVAAIVYDNYELYAVNTIFGPAIAVYDTLNTCWTGFAISQTGGKRIKQLVKIELAVQALYAVTEDNKLYKLFAGPGTDIATVRTNGICSGELFAGQNVKLANPKMEVKLCKTRLILNNITQDVTCTFTPYVNNRLSASGPVIKSIAYNSPDNPVSGILSLGDVDTQLENILFPTPDCQQGWKVFGTFEWTGGSITQFSMELNNLQPQNPLNSQ